MPMTKDLQDIINLTNKAIGMAQGIQCTLKIHTRTYEHMDTLIKELENIDNKLHNLRENINAND